MKLSLILSLAWWKDAGRRALYSAVAIAIPYLGGSLLTEVAWWAILSAGALGAIASLATSLAGLPETQGVDLPWWLAALERVGKTFGQALAAGLVGALYLEGVDWAFVLQASALAALVSLLRLILATLPDDPTLSVPQAVVIVNEIPNPSTSSRSEYQGAVSAREALEGGGD
jgi:hypothetical protein